jgi:hypothetical protein
MGFVTTILKLYESPEKTFLEVEKKPKTIKQFVGAMVFFLAIYGFIYGVMAKEEITERITEGLWFLVKVPATLILTTFFSIPTLYVISKALGGNLSAKAILFSLFISFTASSLIPIAILPLNILYVATNHHPITIHIISILISAVVVIIYVFKSFINFGKMNTERAVILTFISSIILLFIFVQFLDLFFNISGVSYRSTGLLGGFAKSAVEQISIVR